MGRHLLIPNRARFSVEAINLETGQLLIETAGDYRIVGIDRLLGRDGVELPADAPIHAAHEAEFRVALEEGKPETFTIPLGSNVGDMLPIGARIEA
jgi:hypothetical protein